MKNMRNILLRTIFSILIRIHFSQALWPPAYQINLKQSDIFDLSDILNDEQDLIDIFDDNDEMIKIKELQHYDLGQDLNKFSLLHHMIMKQKNFKRKPEESGYNNNMYMSKPTEHSIEEVGIPYESGYVDNNGKLKSEGKKVYYNPFLKNNKERKDTKKDYRREVSDEHTTTIEDYDYHALKDEYDKQLKVVKSQNKTLNYTTENKDEENLKDAIKTLIKGDSQEDNCTVQETKGIGFKAIKCIFKDLINPNLGKNRKVELYQRIGTIILVWIVVYLLVAIPCWCQRGWCCCCFQCKFCKPRQRIDLAKKFLMDNPEGVYHTVENELIKYDPNSYEVYLQAKLREELNTI